MRFAGPVEFSAAEILGAVVVLLVFYVALPAAGGYLGLRRYRSVRPPELRTRIGSFAWFAAGVVVTSTVIGGLAWIGEMLVS